MPEYRQKRKQGGKGRPFQKGMVNNPAGSTGRLPIPADIKELREQAKTILDNALHKQLAMTQSQLHVVHTDPKSTIAELASARFLQRAVNEGDVPRFALIADRVLGPMQKSIAIDTTTEVRNSVQTMGASVLTKIMERLQQEANVIDCEPVMLPIQEELNETDS